MVRIAPFVKIDSQTPDLNTVQKHVELYTQQINKSTFLNAKIISNVSLIAGDNLIAHQLGDNYTSCTTGIPTTNTNSFIYQKSTYQNQTVDRSKYICLNASIPITLDIWVI